MTSPLPPLGIGVDASARAAERAARLDPRLAQSAQELEGLFVQQLFTAMRATVPQDGLISGGAGEEMFTAMLHEHLAEEAPARWTQGLAAQIAQQFTRQSASAPEPTP